MPKLYTGNKDAGGRAYGIDEFVVEPMEPRLLLSADALGIDAGVLDRDAIDQLRWDPTNAADEAIINIVNGSDETKQVDEADTPEPLDPIIFNPEPAQNENNCNCLDVLSSAPLAAASDNTDARREIVFLDAGVADGEILLADLAKQNNNSITEVYLLDQDQDGVEQIEQILSLYNNVDAVHLVSHGSSQGLQIGNTWLTADNIDEYGSQLQQLGNALSENGDILLYGCDLAADPLGQALIQQFGLLTSADVAASTDLTGTDELGGDWDLEYRFGQVGTALVGDQSIAYQWKGLLGDNLVPGAQSTNEDTTLVFSAATLNPITVSDGAAGDGTLRVSLSVSNGILTLATSSGLTIENGADVSSAMTFTGSESAINTAMDGLQFAPNADYSGPANLQIKTEHSAGLFGQYTFDNVGDVGNDDSPPGANDGLVNGAISTVDGTRGNVLTFDGDDYVRIPGQFGNPTNVTLSAWVNLDSGFVSDEVISLGDNIALRVDDGIGGVQGFFFNGSVWQHTRSSVNVNGTGWHHVAYTFDDANDQQYLYIDGVEVAATTHSASISYTLGTDTYMGRNGNAPQQYLHGSLDDVRIYDRALSAGEILALGQANTSDTDNIVITVNPLNDAPTVAYSIADQNVTQDVAFSFQVAANTFSDIDAGDTLSYSASLVDDTALPDWLSFDAATQTFSGTPLNAGVGSLSVKVTADDGNGGTVSETFVITVANINDAPTVITTPPITPIVPDVSVDDTIISVGGPSLGPDESGPSTLEQTTNTLEQEVTVTEEEPIDSVPGEGYTEPETIVFTDGDHGSPAVGDHVQDLLKSFVVRQVPLGAMAALHAFKLDALASEINSVLESSGFNDSLNRMREDISNETLIHQTVVGSGIAVTTGLSVGYVAWLVRGGVLLTTALSSLPAWQFIDPLPVLARTRDSADLSSSDNGEDDSLEDIIREQSAEVANTEKRTNGKLESKTASEPLDKRP